ncbi:unnamed protein product [Pelagomonas calceolata]|uniref:Tetratricopeptide repeat protein n=1 Tax=Pelagomonas calceolata TaxID=35677 RepID=A0A8J2S730_9STRA|nr:unnamed protein product [Pelagomonas calceolata]
MYSKLGRIDSALQMEKDVYSGRLRLNAEQRETLLAANNYALSLFSAERSEEAKSVLRKMMPVARRTLGESDQLALSMRWCYAGALYGDPGATLAELREAVETLESVAPLWRRVFGDSHPETPRIHDALANARERFARAAAASESESPP